MLITDWFLTYPIRPKYTLSTSQEAYTFRFKTDMLESSYEDSKKPAEEVAIIWLPFIRPVITVFDITAVAKVIPAISPELETVEL